MAKNKTELNQWLKEISNFGKQVVRTIANLLPIVPAALGAGLMLNIALAGPFELSFRSTPTPKVLGVEEKVEFQSPESKAKLEKSKAEPTTVGASPLKTENQ